MMSMLVSNPPILMIQYLFIKAFHLVPTALCTPTLFHIVLRNGGWSFKVEDFSCNVMYPHNPDEDHQPPGEGDDLPAPVSLDDANRIVWLPS